MFRKVHLYLTALCAGITTAILLVMSLLYLYLSENGLYENQFHSFQNDMNTIATALEQQSVISMEWLSKMEARGDYTFYVLDNGVPFLYNRLSGSGGSPVPDGSPVSDSASPSDGNPVSDGSPASDSISASDTPDLLTACLEEYQNCEDYTDIQTELSSGGLYNTCFHTEFPFNPTGLKHEYYAGVIELDKGASSLQIVVLSPLHFLREQIEEQRTRFLLIDLAAILLLTLFSFFFTGRVLAPVVESRDRQTAFVAAASHELRTPLSVILSAAECCKNAPEENRLRFLDTIQQEGAVMTSLVNDMLTLSASDSMNFSMQPKAVELDTLLINAYEAFEPLAAEKKLSLTISLPDNALPPCTADADRLMQLLSILLHNAISYTPEGGRIDLALTRKKNRFLLSVSDTGPGIPPEDRKRIFERFYRTEKSRSAKGHFGLGLSIASEIVKLHHGTIAVSGREGGGSVFTVTLP